MKNAITVIDQELIDRVQLFIDERMMLLGRTHQDITELIEMAKDLIEINAELTKREQKYKSALEWMVRVNAMDYEYKAVAKEALKGDSDD